jgi:tetratricopeptide (TPR) repeat protein
MADKTESRLPRLTPEQRRAAAGQYERATQVLAKGHHDYAIPLLLKCCEIDPGNAVYRQVLRQATKAKYGNNNRGGKLSAITNLRDKFHLRKAQLSGDHFGVLKHGEQILARNPWDVATHLIMASAFQELELNDLAIWSLEQARQVDGTNLQVNRFLARLYEKRGNFNQAIALWQLVRKADPSDTEAHNKAKDIAASATIAKGRYDEAVNGGAPTPVVQPGAVSPVATQSDAAPSSGAPATLTHAALKETMEQVLVPDTLRETPALPSGPPTDDRVREAPALQAKIKADPTNPLGYLHLAQLYRRADKFDKARETLAQGLGATGNHFNLALELADLEIEPFRRDFAIAQQMLRHDPNNADLHKVRQRLEREINARELNYFRQRVERFPTDTSSRFEMSLRLMRVGQLDEAIKELQALRSDPRHQSKVLVHLGFCFRSRNNWRLAQRNFEEALQHLSPNDEELRKEVLYQLAEGYAGAGDISRAVDLGCELANLDFAYKDIGKLLDRWQAKLQKA